MPAYSFQERFIPLIKNGTKTQTIRKKRKGQAKPGSPLYLYFGLRTKYCKKIAERVCKSVVEIIIEGDGNVLIGGRKLSTIEKERLAVQDGFENFETMFLWWNQTHNLPFIGDIIYWAPF